MNEIVIRPEDARDHEAIDGVLLDAFRDTEDARMVRRLRQTGELTLGLVAEVKGVVAAYVACVAVPVTPDPGYPFWAFAALTFWPEGERAEIVSALLRDGLARARAQGVGFVAVLGNPSFYGAFGFRAELTRGLRAPWSGYYYLGLQLAEGPAPIGVAHYPDAFMA